MSNQAKYHHLIPRTYLKSWCHSESIYYFKLEDLSTPEERNINNHFGINHYNTIKAGMPIASNEDLERIFKSLSAYSVSYNGNILASVGDYNRYFFDFEEWDIYYPNDTKVSKKKKNNIKDEINKEKILDIEHFWGEKYEAGWQMLLSNIKSSIEQTKDGKINGFNAEELIKFVVSMDWRSPKSNFILENELKEIDLLLGLSDIDIPFNERDINHEVNVFEWFKRNYLLKKFKQLHGNKGILYDISQEYQDKMNLKFLVAPATSNFITSDNPSFSYSNESGLIHIMPLNPKILVEMENRVDCKEDMHVIKTLDDSAVNKYNSIIISAAENGVISVETEINYR